MNWRSSQFSMAWIGLATVPPTVKLAAERAARAGKGGPHFRLGVHGPSGWRGGGGLPLQASCTHRLRQLYARTHSGRFAVLCRCRHGVHDQPPGFKASSASIIKSVTPIRTARPAEEFTVPFHVVRRSSACPSCLQSLMETLPPPTLGGAITRAATPAGFSRTAAR